MDHLLTHTLSSTPHCEEESKEQDILMTFRPTQSKSSIHESAVVVPPSTTPDDRHKKKMALNPLASPLKSVKSKLVQPFKHLKVGKLGLSAGAADNASKSSSDDGKLDFPVSTIEFPIAKNDRPAVHGKTDDSVVRRQNSDPGKTNRDHQNKEHSEGSDAEDGYQSKNNNGMYYDFVVEAKKQHSLFASDKEVQSPSRLFQEYDVRSFGQSQLSSLGMSLEEAKESSIGDNTRQRRLVECSSLTIYLDEYEDVSGLIQSLSMNTLLTNLSVTLYRKRGSKYVRTTEELKAFFDAVEELPHLRYLALQNFTPEVMPIVTEALYFHLTIESLHLHLTTGTVKRNFVEACATMPRLFHLELDVHASLPLGILLASKRLQILRIGSDDFKLEHKHVAAFAKNLSRNKRLKVLDLEPKLSAMSLSTILHSLRSHNKSLQEFYFAYSNRTMAEGNFALLEVIHALESNKALRVLWNHQYDTIVTSEDFQARLFKVFSESETLEQFLFFEEDPAFQQQAAKILKQRKANRGKSSQPTKGIFANCHPIDLACGLSLCQQFRPFDA